MAEKITMIQSGKTAALSEAERGDTVLFGSYKQGNTAGSGKEAIEWLVLDKQDGKLLLLSKYALDCKKYNEERERVTWETCTLRSWLNGEFYNTAFSQTERERIVTTKVKNEDNPVHGSTGGNDTNDKVFLLSIGEVLHYFHSDPEAEDPARRAKVTEYAKAQGALSSTKSESAGNGWWWLRSPGNYGLIAAEVGGSGRVDVWGGNVDNDYDVVRPALWLNPES